MSDRLRDLARKFARLRRDQESLMKRTAAFEQELLEALKESRRKRRRVGSRPPRAVAAESAAAEESVGPAAASDEPPVAAADASDEDAEAALISRAGGAEEPQLVRSSSEEDVSWIPGEVEVVSPEEAEKAVLRMVSQKAEEEEYKYVGPNVKPEGYCTFETRDGRKNAPGPYKGMGEKVGETKYTFPDPPQITSKAKQAHFLRYPAGPTRCEFATVCKMAPFYVFKESHRVLLRPCLWLRRQLGVFLRSSSRVPRNTVVHECITVSRVVAGGYCILMEWESWMSAPTTVNNGVLMVAFQVSPQCPSIYINTAERTWPRKCMNATWVCLKGDATGEVGEGGVALHVPVLAIKLTKTVEGFGELFVPYGWNAQQWKEALSKKETLMQRYLTERKKSYLCAPKADNAFPSEAVE